MLDLTIPERLRDAAEGELEPGERVVWVGRPAAKFFTPAATGAFLFGIPWTAFACFWMAGAAGFKMPQFNQGFDLFPLFGVPFVLIGFGMLSAPLWAYFNSLATAYVITDRRAISFEGLRTMTIRSYPPERLTDVYRKERRDGSGDVIFSRRAWRDSDGDRKTEELGFVRVERGFEVEFSVFSFQCRSWPSMLNTQHLPGASRCARRHPTGMTCQHG